MPETGLGLSPGYKSGPHAFVLKDEANERKREEKEFPHLSDIIKLECIDEA